MVFLFLQIQLRRDNPCTASVQYLIRTAGARGCNEKERSSRSNQIHDAENRLVAGKQQNNVDIIY
jgi:hypothetical protein